jgi:hypothetical protein
MNSQFGNLKQMTLEHMKHYLFSRETETTHEIFGFSRHFENVMDSDFEDAEGFDVVSAHDIVMSARMALSQITLGAYKVSHYISMFWQLDNLTRVMTGANKESRQFVITFPATHCFQGMQFLFRGEELIVITTMRSCNLEVNFVTDCYLSYAAARLLQKRAHELWPCSAQTIRVIMNIGSLHVFKGG